ncbi:hypothetical protein [Streptomyces youssoufiensis]
MTQSGQGNEPQPPAVPPAHEGVVLPSAGLRHGGGQGAPYDWPSPEQAAPAEGQPWGDPWGPDAPRPPQGPPPGAPAGQAGTLMPREPGPGQPLPPAAPVGYGQAPGHDSDATQLIPPVGGSIPGGPPPGALPGPMPGAPLPGGAQPLPPEGAPGPAPAPGYGGPGAPLPAEDGAFPALPPHQAHQPGQQQGYGYPQPQQGYGYPQPGQTPGYPAQQQGYGYPQQGYGYPQPSGQPTGHAQQADQGQAPRQQPGHPGPYPGQPQQSGQAPGYPAQSGQFSPYGGQPGQPGQNGQPGQSGQPAPYQQPEAQPQTQILRAQPAPPEAGQGGHTQILRPQPPAPAADQGGHTQILRPQPPAPGQQPRSGHRQPQPEPRKPPESPAESTTMLRRPNYDGGPPRPGAGEETQVLPGPIPATGQPPHPGGAPYGVRPGAPGDRQPPAEFDGLFRADGAADGPDSTQQMPLYQQDPGPQPPQQGPPHGSYGHGHGPGHDGPAGYDGPGAVGYSGDDGGRRRSRRGVVIGAVVAACAVAGLAAGAAMSMGDDDKKDKGDKSTDPGKEVVASESAAPSASPSPTPTKTTDPAEPQAKALDALLKDSGNSRASVIASVNNIKTCKALPKAAADLRSAAQQRNALVTRLGELKLDKIPQNAELTRALTKAWRSSASADNHYAAWADQAAKKKGCVKGKARVTGHTASGNRASGEASAAKKQAADLWNPVARKFKLTERQAAQL